MRCEHLESNYLHGKVLCDGLQMNGGYICTIRVSICDPTLLLCEVRGQYDPALMVGFRLPLMTSKLQEKKKSGGVEPGREAWRTSFSRRDHNRKIWYSEGQHTC